ncbi:hypothetical protein [Cecembia sp.]|uniref:hypothetical protein n=2 Tax=Cecembia sp. TaxID=1898110 RepID=UPI0025BBFA38|nr:hypothetical protein [Cecembia sp.]
MKTKIKILSASMILLTSASCTKSLSPVEFHNACAIINNNSLVQFHYMKQIALSNEFHQNGELNRGSFQRLNFDSQAFREDFEYFVKITPKNEDERVLHALVTGIKEGMEAVLKNYNNPLQNPSAAIDSNKVSDEMNDFEIKYVQVMDLMEEYLEKIHAYKTKHNIVSGQE